MKKERIGGRRLTVRARVRELVDYAQANYWGPARLLAALRVAMTELQATPGSRTRRVFMEELRAAGAPIRDLPDRRQLSLFGDAA